jgi:hypothetical protein
VGIDEILSTMCFKLELLKDKVFFPLTFIGVESKNEAIITNKYVPQKATRNLRNNLIFFMLMNFNKVILQKINYLRVNFTGVSVVFK